MQEGGTGIVISESGLYGAISRSNEPAAKDFQRRGRKDILPSIRKTGSYSMMAVLKILTDAFSLYARDIELREKADKRLAIAAPKADSCDTLAGSKDAIKKGRVAKDATDALGYKWHHTLVNNIPDEWIGVLLYGTPGGVQEMTTLSEQGCTSSLAHVPKEWKGSIVTDCYPWGSIG